MPLGHGSFETMRRRRLHPSAIGWGLAVAGPAILASAALSGRPYVEIALASLGLLTGFISGRLGRIPGLAVALLSGIAFLLFEYLEADLAQEHLLAAVLALGGFIALAVAVAEICGVTRGLLQSTHLDQATHLPNYDLFMRFLEVEAARSARHRLPFSIVILELDNLEAYGHDYGYWRTDALLKELSGVMAGSLRRSDVLGRLGGPQFGLLLPMTNPGGAALAVQRLEMTVKMLPMPSRGDLAPHALAWKVGIAEFPGDGQDALDLLQAAKDRLAAGPPPALLPAP